MATEHKLKCLPDYFGAVRRKEKTFEVRRDDRGFQKGDTIVLREWLPELGGRYSGNNEHRKIKYILTGGQFGIEPGYVVLGF
jgi:hypothetical protein